MGTLLDFGVREIPAERGADARQPSGWRRLPAGVWICAGLLLVVWLVQGWNIMGYPTVSDDEGTYLAQAWALQHAHGLAPYTYWYDHPPFGWIQVAAMSWAPSILPGDHLTVAAARFIMLPVTGASCVLIYLLARRLALARWIAALAVALFALSPLSVSLQREIFLDNFAVVWMLAAFVLTLSPRCHLWQHVAGGACAALSILSKETMAVVVPALLVSLWQGTHRSTREFSFAGFGAAFILMGAQYPLYALLKGELFPGVGHVSLLGGLIFQMERPGSGSLLVAGSGSYAIFHSWLYYDPVLVIGGAIGAAVALAWRRLRAPALAAVLLSLVAMRPNGYLPAMYVIQALPFFAIVLAALVGRGAELLWARERRWGMVSRRVAVTACGATISFYLTPLWVTGDYRAETANPNAIYSQAATWIRAHVTDPRHSRIVVDDTLWPDMVRDGFQPGLGAIWFYKVDLDPAVARTLPHGWRDLTYIVSSPAMRENPNSMPTVSAALTHSTVLAAFGTGADRIEVRKIIKAGP
jgi:4-amino-4-deoxy-L-arabinose transferase-like glycosyltransferase